MSKKNKRSGQNYKNFKGSIVIIALPIMITILIYLTNNVNSGGAASLIAAIIIGAMILSQFYDFRNAFKVKKYDKIYEKAFESYEKKYWEKKNQSR